MRGEPDDAAASGSDREAQVVTAEQRTEDALRILAAHRRPRVEGERLDDERPGSRRQGREGSVRRVRDFNPQARDLLGGEPSPGLG